MSDKDCSLLTLTVRFKVLSNNHLQIHGIKKTDEGSYTCEARLMARGEIDLRIIKVIVNGQHPFFLFLPFYVPLGHVLFQQVSFDT